MGCHLVDLNNDIDDDDQELDEGFGSDGEDSEELSTASKDHQQKLMEKRRAIEDRLADMQLMRDTSDFDLDDLDDWATHISCFKRYIAPELAITGRNNHHLRYNLFAFCV